MPACVSAYCKAWAEVLDEERELFVAEETLAEESPIIEEKIPHTMTRAKTAEPL